MKISTNSLRAFNARNACAPDPAADGADALLQRIGSQLAAVEKTIDFGSKYAGVVIVRVAECRKHENSDHLNICLIDDGGITPDVKREENGLVQVVCGAPNVRAGLTVAWLPPGSTVPSSIEAGDPFVLGARELRGVLSNGMLASPKELALGDNHDGILEIDPQLDGDENGEIKPGTSFAEHFNLAGDTIIDMENKMFTHRPDLFGTMGVARELAGIAGQRFVSPEWYRADATIVAEADDMCVEIRNEIPELVPRFCAVPMDGITIAPSPVWLQVELTRSGVRPINNIVDLTNYYMLLTGQPLHAYDYDKVVAQDSIREGAEHATIVIRHPLEAEELALLNGKTIKPRSEAILIASATKAIGLGGVMGGGDTEVDEHTTRIILESANFDMYSIRRTSMAHGLFSEAVTRFNKGQSPLQNMAVLARIAKDVASLAGGRVAGVVQDDNHLASEMRDSATLHSPLTVDTGFINDRLGVELTSEAITELLANVEFMVEIRENQLTVTAPFWRTDIEIPEDIVEEVGRLYGFDKLPQELPRRSAQPAAKNPAFELKAALRGRLRSVGASEVLTYSFVSSGLLDKVEQDKEMAFRLSNALSPELQQYRLSITPSLLEKVHANIKAGASSFALFELGKGHMVGQNDEDGLPREFDRLGLVFAADDRTAASDYAGAAYYQAQAFLNAALGVNVASVFSLVPLAKAAEDGFGGHAMIAQMVAPFDPARSAVLWNGSYVCGVIGEYKPAVRRALKLPKYAAGFELFMSAFRSVTPIGYQLASKYPAVWQDICLRVPAGTTYAEVYGFLDESLQALSPADSRATLEPVDIYQKEGESEHRQLTFRYRVASELRTLTDSEVAGLLDLAANQAKERFGAERV